MIPITSERSPLVTVIHDADLAPVSPFLSAPSIYGNWRPLQGLRPTAVPQVRRPHPGRLPLPRLQSGARAAV